MSGDAFHDLADKATAQADSYLDHAAEMGAPEDAAQWTLAAFNAAKVALTARQAAVTPSVARELRPHRDRSAA